MANELDPYKILNNHLVRTGFQDQFNKLVDIVIFDVSNDGNGNLIFKTNTGDITVPIASDLDDLINVDLTGATAGDVLSYNGSNWIATTPTSGDLTYIRPDTSTRSGFNDVSNITSVTDALDKILFPFVNPSFSSFTISGKSSTYELGDSLVGTAGETVTFSWGVNTIGNISNSVGYDIIDVTNSNTNLTTNLLPNTTLTTSINIGYQITRTSIGSYQFKIVGTDTESNTFNKTKTYSWSPRRHWGTSPNTSLNSAEILGLASNELSNGYTQTRSMDGNGEYVYFCWLESLGDTSGFLVGNLPNSAFTKQIVSHTNQYGYTENYITYRTDTVQFGTGISIEVT